MAWKYYNLMSLLPQNINIQTFAVIKNLKYQFEVFIMWITANRKMQFENAPQKAIKFIFHILKTLNRKSNHLALNRLKD